MYPMHHFSNTKGSCLVSNHLHPCDQIHWTLLCSHLICLLNQCDHFLFPEILSSLAFFTPLSLLIFLTSVALSFSPLMFSPSLSFSQTDITWGSILPSFLSLPSFFPCFLSFHVHILPQRLIPWRF